ncbi:MAG TPA: chromosomal replication initiator protein DnaA [Desulfotomaculum sp.]|jgi:chromosomal replication initiator protein|nr:chromosomal replication initiator protein DnaA [Desulfotomaculum sp.]HCJ79833.1 chromosomal replication initiator protein DnaA [Desulfotomaculum sp.]
MLKSELINTWNLLLDNLRPKINKHSFETWFKTLQPIGYENKTLFIEVPDSFTREWLLDHYTQIIKRTLRNITHQELELKFILTEEVAYLPYKFTQNNKVDSFNQLSLINSKHTFETFVMGNSNHLTHAACLAVAQSPAKAYNPLFIYGGVGLGKTHLLHAICNYALKNNHNSKTTYTTTETFMNELINAIRENATSLFRQKYRHMDILLIDDIQFLAGKEGTQEEFFHTFNTLYEANKQIVISSDRLPKDIHTLEDRLCSRFEWGLITDIQPPDLETRVAILYKKVFLNNYKIPNDVINYIAASFESNIRELEGALIKVCAYKTLTNQEITLELAKEILKELIPSQQPRQITVSLIKQKVAEYFGLKPTDFTTKRRTHNIAYPRQIAMYLTRELTGLSLPKIGEAFGGRDHSTVIHAYEKIALELRDSITLQEIINIISHNIKGT